MNAVVGTDAIAFEAFAAAVPAASESTAGKAEIATQAEVDGGTDDLRFITPAKLAAWAGRLKRVASLVGAPGPRFTTELDMYAYTGGQAGGG